MSGETKRRRQERRGRWALVVAADERPCEHPPGNAPGELGVPVVPAATQHRDWDTLLVQEDHRRPENGVTSVAHLK